MEERKGIRITTWNVNGIRNPFGYEPWRRERTFAAMFEILEADIVVMQETKIQKKDLGDDMVLVPGWDVFFSLPKHKKGYSGVAVYTRNAVCAPIKAEEGITGILTPPSSTTSFRDLPEDQQIGGYPTAAQLSDCPLDLATLDSEGRCVILEFPAFILIGVYNPANRDESRDDFRIGFLDALDARVRNLVGAGKRVFLTGDLNIIRGELDTANAEEQLRKQGITMDDYISTPARRMLNQMLFGGKVIGERDEGREKPVMWDICRSFHPDRKGMFTCWEQKINARPGNFGSRIDYVLFSEDPKDWFCESNIQEGLLGSDHCPVYAVFGEKVRFDGKEVFMKDIMSDGLFKDGVRQRDWRIKDLLPMSAKLMPEFDRRRSIRDMFTRKPTFLKELSSVMGEDVASVSEVEESFTEESSVPSDTMAPGTTVTPPEPAETADMPSSAKPMAKSTTKRVADAPSTSSPRPVKRGKSASSSKPAPDTGKGQSGKGQSSLTGFFKPKLPVKSPSKPSALLNGESESAIAATISTESAVTESAPPEPATPPRRARSISLISPSPSKTTENLSPAQPANSTSTSTKPFVDPIVAKESWSRLLGKRVVPRCDHREPCISLVTKKPGVNCGRSFYICPRPLGPSGQKEKNTQWRCGTFIWSSDWLGEDGAG